MKACNQACMQATGDSAPRPPLEASHTAHPAAKEVEDIDMPKQPGGNLHPMLSRCCRFGPT